MLNKTSSTEKVKAFIKILYLIIGYGLLRELRESSLAKDEKRLDWMTLQRSCLKGDLQAHAWSGMSRTVRKPNEQCNRWFGLKLVRW